MLELKDLYKTFGAVKAVAGIDLAVNRGETVVLMGPSGCGKSTTIRMVNRLVEPDQGEVWFRGQNLVSLPQEELRQVRKKVGFVFQHFNLIGRLSAIENVMLGLVMDGMERELAADKAKLALDKVGLIAYSSQKPMELSGGQQQRVGIARALAAEPELMLWDEPTASLDPILVREVLLVMEDLAKYQASTMVVVTHELPFALHVADRIVLMDQGKIVETGSPQTVFQEPQSVIGNEYKALIEYQMSISARALA
ncbi:MAG: amino acid ABC transporter ATP-binding protein [Sporomusaceae bacterium]|nr:amino acid ABC transporter ATP-binding protein [Sporomusaceae bacterium]